MFELDKNYILRRASEYGFIRDTLEKVYRLVDILEYINAEPKIKDKLALKGGTAINMTIFDLPRLSVDIDIDYLINCSKDAMFIDREMISKILSVYMESGGYKLNSKTKNPHSLDSWVYEYLNFGGNKDTLKIEINYSLRTHVFPAQAKSITVKNLESEHKLNCLNSIEIFASKSMLC